MAFDPDAFWSALTSFAFLKAAAITLALALLSHATAILVAVPLALALMGSKGVLYRLVQVYVGLFRGAPTLLQLLFVWNALPQFIPVLRDDWFTPFLAAFIALALNEAAYQVEINRAALQSVERGQFDAGRSLGLTRLKILWLVVLPQALRVALPPTVNEFISLLKITSLASVISLHELMTVTAQSVATSFLFTEYYAAALVYYLAMVYALMAVQARVERRFAWASGNRADLDRLVRSRRQ
jgi:His/Glu/Gln/Arg/opine family amino acid ABC transporter permease subunit